MDLELFGETFVTLAVIMDPIGLAPIFLAMTRTLPASERRAAAVRAVLAAGGLVIAFALGGGLLLEYLHVSVDSLSIAGGLLLLLVALEMLRGEDYPEDGAQDIALVPLATPLVAGPGAIATVIVLERNAEGAGASLSVLLGILAALAAVLVTLLAAGPLSQVLPDSFIDFLTRVLGLLLSAIAVQLVVDGVKGVAA